MTKLPKNIHIHGEVDAQGAFSLQAGGADPITLIGFCEIIKGKLLEAHERRTTGERVVEEKEGRTIFKKGEMI